MTKIVHILFELRSCTEIHVSKILDISGSPRKTTKGSPRKGSQENGDFSDRPLTKESSAGLSDQASSCNSDYGASSSSSGNYTDD